MLRRRFFFVAPVVGADYEDIDEDADEKQYEKEDDKPG